MFLSRASGVAGRLRGIAVWAAPPPRIPDAHPFGFANQGRLQQRRHQQQQQQQQRDFNFFPRARPHPILSDDGLLFEHVEPPPLGWWREFQEARGLGGLTPETCLSTFTQYCLVVTKRGSGWKTALERDHNIDPYTLHYTALPLLNRSGPPVTVGMHMLFTASSMNYTPSILTLMGMHVCLRDSRDGKGKMPQSWREVDARFKRLLQTEKNPDAFTLHGLSLLREGKGDAFALRYFDKAIEAARDLPGGARPGPAERGAPTVREPRWTLEASCHRMRGAILLRQNRRQEAVDAFKILALELDHADGYAQLVRLLPLDPEERETYLLKAAQGGSFEACGLLALHMADKAAGSDLPPGERVVAAGLAREWALIEPDDAKRARLLAQVAGRTRAAFEPRA
ncbi:hypothetical protein VTH06DRAFT_3393 [Thermothelomyces fergusii]